MFLVKIIILGIIQGITGLMPVGSSGHVVLVGTFLGVSDSISMSFLLLLQLGSLAGIFSLYFREFFTVLVKGLADVLRTLKPTEGDVRETGSSWKLLMQLLMIGSIPAVILSIILFPLAEQLSSQLLLIAMCFLANALLLVITSVIAIRPRKLKDVSWGHAVIIGAVEGVSILPGLSVFGAPSSAAFLCEVQRKTVILLSYFLMIPTTIVLFIFSLFRQSEELAMIGFLPCLLAFLAAGFFSCIFVRLIRKWINRGNYRFFALYSVIIGVVTLVYYLAA